jgi:hypothetical protein
MNNHHKLHENTSLQVFFFISFFPFSLFHLSPVGLQQKRLSIAFWESNLPALEGVLVLFQNDRGKKEDESSVRMELRL